MNVDDRLKTGNRPHEIIVSLPNEEQAQSATVVTLSDFLSREIPPREYMLSPIIPCQGLGMIHAYRGVGKTHMAIGITCAVASGGTFLKWKADKPRSVLLLDGEMPAVVLQERFAHAVQASDKKPEIDPKIITPDFQDRGMPDLSTNEGQEIIERELDGIELIIVDNISTLCRNGRENEAEGWLPVQEWALRMRSSGRSVLFIHHSGKGGNQRGTSKREDVLDTVISLRRPKDYDPQSGAVFEVYFEKSRGIFGDDTAAFEASLTTDKNGQNTWVTRTIEESTLEKVVALLEDEYSQKEIGVELELSKGYVSKLVKQARAKGMIS